MDGLPPAWAVKRLIDVTVAGWGLVLTAPLLLAIAAAVRLTSPGGPVLSRQRRTGRFDRPFTAYGFRTLPPEAEVGAPPTPVGRLLRRTGLEALPALLNVLLGDMSLVGPRARSSHLDERYREVRPGLTGWAEANDRAGTARSADRAAYDRYYVEHWSLGLDLQILLLTALRLATPRRPPRRPPP